MAPSLTHIGVAVANLTAGVGFYRALGFEPHPETMSLRRVETPDHPILQLNPNIENVTIAFVPTSNGVGIELFQFDMSQDTQAEDSITDPGTVVDSELMRIFHLAIKPDQEDPEKMQEDIVAAGGQKLGSTLPLGKEHKATNSRDPWGTIIEAISCDFDDLLKILFGA